MFLLYTFSIVWAIVIFFTKFSTPKKILWYLTIFFIFMWWFIGNYYKNNVPTISNQLDTKSWNVNVNWFLSSSSNCTWNCSNYSSSSSHSSRGWGWWGWGWGWWK